MASTSAIAVADGESSPVTHTFSPTGANGIESSWTNQVETLIDGRESILLKKARNRTMRTPSLHMKAPFVVTEVLNGVNVKKIQDYGTAKTVYTFPVSWTPQQCKNLRVMHANAQLNAHVVALVENDESPW